MDKYNSFLGKGWSFPPEFGKHDNPTRMVSDEEDIQQSLIILLSTRIGERIITQYGSEVNSYLFEQLTLTRETLLRDSIEKSILLYEPRITPDSITIDRSTEENGILKIEIKYTIRMTNQQQNLVYPFYLNDGK